MTKLYVKEYIGLGATDNGSTPIVNEPPIASYVVDYTAGVTPSQKFDPRTKVVEIHMDSIASVKFGPFGTVTAVITADRYNANERVIRVISQNDGTTGLSAITNT